MNFLQQRITLDDRRKLKTRPPVSKERDSRLHKTGETSSSSRGLQHLRTRWFWAIPLCLTNVVLFTVLYTRESYYHSDRGLLPPLTSNTRESYYQALQPPPLLVDFAATTRSPSNILYPTLPLNIAKRPDYGGLNVLGHFPPTQNSTQPRVIARNDDTEYQRYRRTLLKEMDDSVDEEWLPDIVDVSGCSRNKWERYLFPNCNTFHEHTLERPKSNALQSVTARYAGSGSYRDSWIMMDQQRHLNTQPVVAADGFVWKCMILDDPELNFDHKRFKQIQVDAIIMERLTQSPNIADIYGHCGTSVITERLIESVVQEMLAKSRRRHVRGNDMYPSNNLTLAQKLDMAIELAESIADLHGFAGGAMFHADFHSPQWLRSVDGRHIKLNDFNKAVILKFNRRSGEYCPVDRCYEGSFRSPEDNRCRTGEGTEASDVYSLGNTFYVILTGQWPHSDYDEDDRELIRGIRKGKLRPLVDSRYRDRSTVEAGLVHIMEQCWEFDYKKRVSVFEVLRQLYDLRKTTTANNAVPAI